jgi:NTE family protein
MHKQLAFVLGGGGARGALQAGALRALVEAQVQPDFLVGSSAGAINATFLAAHGYTSQAVEGLLSAWRAAAVEDLLPMHYSWFALRLLMRRSSGPTYGRLRDFYVRYGVTPELRFEHLPGPQLFLVAADLRLCRPLIYGIDLGESVLDGLVASTALPPWVLPQESGGCLVVDGGFTSNLPIEPALSLGATEIVALDVDDGRVGQVTTPGLAAFLVQVVLTAQQREKEMELALAAARHVCVHHIPLQFERPVALWDFSHTNEALERGYQLAREAIARQRLAGGSQRRTWASWLRSRWLVEGGR